MSRGRYPRRINLRSLDEHLVARYLLNWRSRDLYNHPEKFPRITSHNLFANQRPLEFDVGCGTGEFLVTLARHHPDKNFVGVDIATKPLLRAVQAAHAAWLKNIVFIRADIKLLLPLLVDDSLLRLYLFFPVPYRKAKHRKRLVFNQAFVDHAYRALTAGGRISVMTDNRKLFVEMIGLVETGSRFEIVRELDSPDETLTHNQRIWESRERTTLRFEAEKAL